MWLRITVVFQNIFWSLFALLILCFRESEYLEQVQFAAGIVNTD